MSDRPWFKFHVDFATDPVMRMLSFEDQRHYVVAMCMKAMGLLDREYPDEQTRRRVISSVIGLSDTPSAKGDESALDAANRRLRELGFVDERWNPTNWEARQTPADPTAAERVRRYRERHTNPVRAEIVARDGARCGICAQPVDPRTAHIDHIVPLLQGGTDTTENKQLAHAACNHGKAGGESRLPWRHESMPPVTGRLRKPVTRTRLRPEVEVEVEVETEIDRKSAPRAAARPAKRAPADFQITEQLREWAARCAPGVDIDRETELWKDHEYRAPKRDWNAAWRTWMRRAGEFGARAKPFTARSISERLGLKAEDFEE